MYIVYICLFLGGRMSGYFFTRAKFNVLGSPLFPPFFAFRGRNNQAGISEGGHSLQRLRS